MGGITASSGGRNVDSGDLLSLQASMKKDPPGYEQELLLQLRHFDACVSILLLKSSTAGQSLSGPSSTTGDAGAAKEVADIAMFLAHMGPFYPQYLKDLPQKLLQILDLHESLPQILRRSLTQAVILTRNRKLVELVEILPVLMKLQCTGDRVVRKIAFMHVVHDIRRMNLKHKNESCNRKLQNVLFNLVQGDDEVKSKRALIVLAELYRRKVWIDERTANVICTACLHKSSRIMIASLRFLLGHDQQKDEDEGEDSDSDEEESGKPSVSVNREAIYKAYHKGTPASKKKKQNKLQRAIQSMQKQQRAESREMVQSSDVPLQHVVDPQSFAEKLFGRLRSCNERFEVKLMMMQVVSRVVGIHRLMLLNFYPFLQKYIEPHQRDVTHVLAAAVQACHDLVPPDAIESMVRHLVNHFVHDRARPEVIAVGLNVMREICIRIPLIMTPELLSDLALYKKKREKAVAAAARSVISVYRQLWPSLLEKKDRGRNANLETRPKEFGAVSVATGVAGVELLLEENESDDDDSGSSEEDETDESLKADVSEETVSEGDASEDEGTEEDGATWGELEGDEEERSDKETSDDIEEVKDVDLTWLKKYTASEGEHAGRVSDIECLSDRPSKKRRTTEPGTDDYISTEQSLRSLRRFSAAKEELHKSALANEEIKSNDGDGILSNEDFEHIRSLQAKQAAKAALAASGLAKAGKRRKEASVKLSSPETLSGRRMNPAAFEANVRVHREKEERVAMAKAGREDRLPYGSRIATKQRKTGGLSNREKEKWKAMPLGAVRSKVARNRLSKKNKGSGKNQFKGKKAWKC